MELDLIAQWLYETLSGDATLAGMVDARIYEDMAPEAASHPLIVFELAESADENAVNGSRAAVSAEVTVRAIGEGLDFAPLAPVVNRVDALLHQQRGSVTGLDILGCVRLRSIKYPEADTDAHYVHRGGVYRIWAEPA
jgi:hypothetical protein